MLTLTSPSGTCTVVISPESGGRIESLKIQSSGSEHHSHQEVLLTRDDRTDIDDDPFAWGCFVMVPYCGRVRDGVLNIGQDRYSLPRVHGPHAIHGTAISQNWVVLQCTESQAVLACDLGPEWPFEGTVHHEILLNDDALSMSLTVTAHQPMPVQVGWHPWFRLPESYTMPFAQMLKRDQDGITTNELVDCSITQRGVFDDCFTQRTGSIILRYSDIDLILDSNCSHWVIFDQRKEGLCFEPQSGPPNGLNTAPDVLLTDEQLSRWFEIRWATPSNI